MSKIDDFWNEYARQYATDNQAEAAFYAGYRAAENLYSEEMRRVRNVIAGDISRFLLDNHSDAP
jgi:hypothetical protein